jgi:hypothetical protein
VQSKGFVCPSTEQGVLRATTAGGVGSTVTATIFLLGAEVAGAIGVAVGGAASVSGDHQCWGNAVRSRSVGIGGAAVAGEKCQIGLRLVILVQLQLFQEQVGARAHEGVCLG